MRVISIVSLTVLLAACGAQKESSLNAIGGNIPAGKKPLRVSRAYDPSTTRRSYEMLALSYGLEKTPVLTLYSAINLQGEFVEFLSYEGLKSGDIVTDGSVFVLDRGQGGIKDLVSKDSLDAPMTGFPSGIFSFHKKDSQGVAVVQWTDAEGQSIEPRIIDICSDHYYDRRENLGTIATTGLKLACDIDVSGQDLQITYGKSAEAPEGTTYVFKPATILNAK